ncbi:MAG TPA: branched-chain amino acid ABC transporter permease [Desulfobacterales bacterium]|nr:branched-chain amino acid ABC transporter permease [Desulfobacterales bacterium]
MEYTTDLLNALVLLSNYVLIPSLSYGSQLALGAVGVTLVFGILRFANFYHGEMMSFGTMCTIFITWWFQSLGFTAGFFPTAVLALPLAILITMLLALTAERSVFRFYRLRKSRPVIFVIASVGVMFMLNGIVRMFIGPDEILFRDGQKFLIKAGAFKTMTGLSEGLALKQTQVLTVILAVLAVLLLFWFLQRTRTGKAMRAFSDNEDLALLSGINPERVVMVTWVITAALATLAGVLYGLDKSFKPLVYFHLLLPLFAAAIVGGIGQPVGAILGGYIVAFSEVTATYAFKKFLKYLLPLEMAPDGLMQFLGTDYKFAVSFLILVLVLLVRPTGILRGRVL